MIHAANMPTAIAVFLHALFLALVPRCEGCGAHDGGLEWEDAMTARDASHRDPETGRWVDPTWEEVFFANAPHLLCRGCAADHEAEMTERWQQYYAGRL